MTKKEIKVIGVVTLSNFGGIEVLEINHDEDTVLWRYNFGESQKVQESEIEYCIETETDETEGFYADGTLITFDEIMHTNI